MKQILRCMYVFCVKLNNCNLSDFTYLNYSLDYESLTFKIYYSSNKNAKLEGLESTNFEVGKIIPKEIKNTY